MGPHDDDRDLREAFARQRLEEAARAGEFHRFIANAKARPVVHRWPVLASALAFLAAVALAAMLGRPPDSRQRPELVMLAEWIEPTAFLLRTPARELLTTLPEFARPAMLPADSASPRSN